MKGTQVWSPVQEDSTCCRATKPMCHNYRACTLEPVGGHYWSPCTLESMPHSERSHGNEKPAHHHKSSSHSLTPTHTASKTHFLRKSFFIAYSQQKTKFKYFNQIQKNLTTSLSGLHTLNWTNTLTLIHSHSLPIKDDKTNCPQVT